MSPQQWACRGRRHTGRLRRSARLETVRGHNLGSIACKPSADSPSGRRMAPRSATSATAPNKPRCTAWCSSTPPPSSSRLQTAAGADLLQFVKDEFDAFLECGFLAHGFLRLRCGDCGHDKLVAHSCKRRGLCPSCGARRMAQMAAHLVDHVIPCGPVGTVAAGSRTASVAVQGHCQGPFGRKSCVCFSIP